METQERTGLEQQPQSGNAGEQAEHAAKRARRAVTHSMSWLERRIERGGDGLWHMLKQRPLIGVGIAAGIGLGLATAIGATELAIAFGAGYAAYRALKSNEPPSKALEDVALSFEGRR